jgi:hypothetical protein
MIKMLKLVFEKFLLIQLLIEEHWQYQMVMMSIRIEILLILFLVIHWNHSLNKKN